jgi:excisionase family DNA binding protein
MKGHEMTEPLAVPIPEAARLGGVGRSTVYTEIREGRLAYKKIGRRTVITMADLRAWLASKTGEAA